MKQFLKIRSFAIGIIAIFTALLFAGNALAVNQSDTTQRMTILYVLYTDYHR